jgi:uncharacterized membrane protein YdcZ (DUF606 family)
VITSMTDYTVLALFMAFAIGSCILGIYSLVPNHSIHPLGLNSTRINETACRYTWLGGIDYDSFVGNITIENISVGHPAPGSVIHIGNCSAVVRMYMKDVKTYIQLYPVAGGR